MSMRDLEGEIWRQAKEAFKNPKLRLKDIMEWSTGDIQPHDGEVMIQLESPHVRVCIKAELDLRTKNQHV